MPGCTLCLFARNGSWSRCGCCRNGQKSREVVQNESDHITSETISRRKLLSVLGLGLALAVPTTTLTVSEAEAQTTGMTRRQDRRTGRRSEGSLMSASSATAFDDQPGSVGLRP